MDVPPIDITPVHAATELLPVRSMTKAERDLLNRAVKQDLPEVLRPVARTAAPWFTVKGRTGREIAWAHVPWVGIHDERIDARARVGVYVALLFSVDGRQVVTSLQVGSTGRTQAELEATVADLRGSVTCPDGFTADPPVLIPPALRPAYDTGLMPYRYERASVVQRTVDLGRLVARPQHWTRHLMHLLESYRDWATRQIET